MPDTSVKVGEAQADVQDPLPESNWLWRRLFSFSVTIVLLVMLWTGVAHLAKTALLAPPEGITALLTTLKWVIGLIGMMVTYYMLAPSAEQLARLIKTANLLQSGVTMTKRATVNAIDGTAGTESTVGAAGSRDSYGNVRPATPPDRPASRPVRPVADVEAVSDDDEDVAPRSRT